MTVMGEVSGNDTRVEQVDWAKRLFEYAWSSASVESKTR